jgi:hypothetical protein
MKKNSVLLLFCFICLIPRAQQSQRLTAKRNAYRAADQLVKQQVVFKDPAVQEKG